MTASPTHRTALVTGVTGQDGVYLARLLAEEGTRVIGTVRPGGTTSPRLAAYLPGITVVELDIRDTDGLRELLAAHAPHELYNLAAFTSVGRSWAEPESVESTNSTAVAGLLEAVRDHRDATRQSIRVFHASSAQAGDDSPYARAKAAAEAAVARFRAEDGLHACFAKLHNHESPLRGSQFVTRKITDSAARIANGDPRPLQLGNIEVRRDWGFAGDYVDAMRRMVRSDTLTDLELGTGVDHSLRELITIAFRAVGIADAWPYIEFDSDLVRPSDAPVPVADPEPARAAIGWTAQLSFHETIVAMVTADSARIRTGVPEDPRYLAPPIDTAFPAAIL